MPGKVVSDHTPLGGFVLSDDDSFPWRNLYIDRHRLGCMPAAIACKDARCSVVIAYLTSILSDNDLPVADFVFDQKRNIYVCPSGDQHRQYRSRPHRLLQGQRGDQLALDIFCFTRLALTSLPSSRQFTKQSHCLIDVRRAAWNASATIPPRGTIP
jgi:hypothetical protein